MLQAEPLDDEVDPYQQLAQAVLMQAIKDHANHFLFTNQADFDFWCQVAQVRPKAVREALSRRFPSLTLNHSLCAHCHQEPRLPYHAYGRECKNKIASQKPPTPKLSRPIGRRYLTRPDF